MPYIWVTKMTNNALTDNEEKKEQPQEGDEENLHAKRNTSDKV